MARASTGPKGRCYTRKVHSCRSSAGLDTASLHTVRSSGGGVPPPLRRVDTLNLTALCQRETIHPLSTSQPVSRHPCSLGAELTGAQAPGA